MKVDYIIVGFGLAGLAMARILEKHQKTYIVFEDQSQHSSMVAGGMYNPVILKRFTPVWMAAEQLEVALPQYSSIEKEFDRDYNQSLNILRVFKSVEEQHNWFAASDKPGLEPYMIPEIITEDKNGVNAPFGFGKVVGTGRIFVKRMLADYRSKLMNEAKLINETFDHGAMQITNDEIVYRNFNSSKIVFCEGYGLKNNPYFNTLPLQGSKGETLTIKAPELNIEALLKAAVFVMPLGNDFYKVGATFSWNDKTNIPTKSGKQELIEKLNSFVHTPYEIIGHHAGIRPTVADRRPLVGCHHIYKNLAVLNGLGTRGVMIGPYAALKLFDHLENDVPVPPAMNIDRFR